MRRSLSLLALIILINSTIFFLIPVNVSSKNMSGVGTPPIDTDNYWYIENFTLITTREEFSNGNIVEFGNHSELIQQNGVYKSLWDIQKQNIS